MNRLLGLLPLVAAGVAGSLWLEPSQQARAASTGCVKDDPEILLPPGFCVTIFAYHLGHTRHMAVAEDGTVYVNSWSGAYFRNLSPAPSGGFVVALRDDDGDGRADRIVRVGPRSEEGGTGGTGIAIFEDGLYVEAGSAIMRYPLAPGQLAPVGAAVPVVSGLTTTGGHPMHLFAIGTAGDLFVNVGPDTNSCQMTNRQSGSSGRMPCSELETRADIWRFDANKAGQVFSPASRYATGIRNAGGLPAASGLT